MRRIFFLPVWFAVRDGRTSSFLDEGGLLRMEAGLLEIVGGRQVGQHTTWIVGDQLIPGRVVA